MLMFTLATLQNMKESFAEERNDCQERMERRWHCHHYHRNQYHHHCNLNPSHHYHPFRFLKDNIELERQQAIRDIMVKRDIARWLQAPGFVRICLTWSVVNYLDSDKTSFSRWGDVLERTGSTRTWSFTGETCNDCPIDWIWLGAQEWKKIKKVTKTTFRR